MANKRLIRFYQGYVLPNLLKCIEEDVKCTKQELNTWLKDKFFDCEISTTEMTNDELYEIIYFCFDWGDQLGIYLNFPDNEFEND
jgi:hypothetical protein